MQAWEPASPFERRLQEAFLAGDTAACLDLLRNAEFALPVTAAAAAGDEPAAWATVEAGGLTWLPAYTSVDAMTAAGLPAHCRVATLVELAAGWPDQRWRLAVDPGLPVHVELESGTVARLAVPGMAENAAAYPHALPPVVQKLLPAHEVVELLGGGRRVSGYVHQLLDVAPFRTPAALLDALGDADRRDELTSPQGSLTALRWTAVGPPLYRSPYGGTDAGRMAAVTGWVVEEPPFVGLGLGRNVDRVVREYKVDGLGLPHGAELWELGADGREHRRAVLDGDRGSRWWSYRARWQETEYAVAPDQQGGQLSLRLRTPDGARPVPAAECSDLAFVATVGDWRGEPCMVHDERTDELLVEYTGGRAPVARALGFERIERGVHRAWVARAEVAGLRESVLPLTP